MRYMLLIHTDDSGAAQTQAARAMSADFAAYNQAMAKAGIRLAGDRLQPAATAAQVRIRGERTEVLDGPYADTKEQFAGYYLIDVPDLDQAIAWAARCPAAQRGTVEVRQIWELTGQ